MEKISLESQFFKADDGSIVFFRGINLSATSIYPSQKYDITFKDRPVPIEEAEEIISSLKKNGFNLIRLVVTWDAIEHYSPEKYDEFYIEYLVQFFTIAEKHNMYISILPYQHLWSRASGGGGAPIWTLESIGIEPGRLSISDLYRTSSMETNQIQNLELYKTYYSYPIASMFTTFFGGKMFAPYIIINGINIQDYLQTKFINAYTYLIKSLIQFSNFIGISSLSNPFGGYIGIKNISEEISMGYGLIESIIPFKEMYASEGNSIEVPIRLSIGNKKYSFTQKSKNTDRISLWKDKKFCIWRVHGVWNYDPNGAPMLLRSDYFNQYKNQTINFHSDCLEPFFQKFKKSIDSVSKKLLVFFEQPSHISIPDTKEPTYLSKDNTTVESVSWSEPGSKSFTIPLIKKDIYHVKKEWILNPEKLKPIYKNSIQKNINNSKKYKQYILETLNFSLNINTQQLPDNISNINIALSEVEQSMLSYCIWDIIFIGEQALSDSKNIDEKNKHLYSNSLIKNINQNSIFIRPYPVYTFGLPVSLEYNYKTQVFKYSFKKGKFTTGKCTLFIPNHLYKNGFKVLLNAGSYELDKKQNYLYFKGQTGVDIYGISIHPNTE